MNRPDPTTLPEWQALSRECGLSMQLISNGVNALGRANYADHKGDYYVAFFGLSIGIERLAKLVLVASHAIDHNGSYPSQKDLKKFGHKICLLLDEVESVALRRKLPISFQRPTDAIAKSIVSFLDSFADRGGRYANFEFQAGGGDGFEPLGSWWSDVAENILKKHFYNSKAERKATHQSKLVNRLLSPFAVVMHTAEDGTPLDDFESASYRSNITPYVQKFGRFYSLSIIRWASDVFEKLTKYGCYTKKVDSLFGHHEHFDTFLVGDDLLKSRKRWPLL